MRGDRELARPRALPASPGFAGARSTPGGSAESIVAPPVVETAPDLAAALAAARALVGTTGGKPAIVVAGSLFLAGEARALLLGDAIPVDPIVVSDPAAGSSGSP